MTAKRGRPAVGKVREVRMPDELWNRIAHEAKHDTGESVSAWIRNACALRLIHDNGALSAGAEVGTRHLGADFPGRGRG